MKLFIGSSSEGIEYAKALHAEFEYDKDIEATVWTHQLFLGGQILITSLLDIINKFDIAAFLLTPDDITISRGQKMQSVRDNLIYELGLFTAKLGLGRTFFVLPRFESIKLPSDLAGIIPLTYNNERSDGNKSAMLSVIATQIKSTIKSGDENMLERRHKNLHRMLMEMQREWTGALRISSIDYVVNRVSQSSLSGLIVIDINGMTAINAKYGNQIGDRIIDDMLVILGSISQFDDLVLRATGDTFIICTHRETLSKYINNIAVRIHKRNWSSIATGLYISVTTGCAIRKGHEKYSDWIDRAVYSMNNAKRECKSFGEDMIELPKNVEQSMFFSS